MLSRKLNMARKITGGKYKKSRKKKKFENRGRTNFISIGKDKRKNLRVMGGSEKVILLTAEKANVMDKNGKAKVVKIKSVLLIPSNRYLKGILFKGAIIDTEIGKARITSRPTQHGVVNAVLV